jgi:hypothetical protein
MPEVSGIAGQAIRHSANERRGKHHHRQHCCPGQQPQSGPVRHEISIFQKRKACNASGNAGSQAGLDDTVEKVAVAFWNSWH